MTGTSYELSGCPACGKAHHTTVRDHAAILAEVEELWQFHLHRMREGVPIPRLFDRAFFTQPPPLQLVSCDACGLLYRNPREHAEQVTALYAEEDADPAVMQALHDAQRGVAARQAELLTQIAGRPGPGLEVGSYVGAFLAAARDAGWDFHGVDVGAGVNAFARSLGFHVYDGTIENVRPQSAYAAVAFWNVFDQLPDPLSALTAARRLLRSGGILAIRVPNGAFYTRLTRNRLPRPLARAALAWNNLLAFPYRHGFSPDLLSRLLRAHGFELIGKRPDTLVPIADGWTRPWARLEERIVKRLSRPAAPWFELYARAIA